MESYFYLNPEDIRLGIQGLTETSDTNTKQLHLLSQQMKTYMKDESLSSDSVAESKARMEVLMSMMDAAESILQRIALTSGQLQEVAGDEVLEGDKLSAALEQANAYYRICLDIAAEYEALMLQAKGAFTAVWYANKAYGWRSIAAEQLELSRLIQEKIDAYYQIERTSMLLFESELSDLELLIRNITGFISFAGSGETILHFQPDFSMSLWTTCLEKIDPSSMSSGNRRLLEQFLSGALSAVPTISGTNEQRFFLAPGWELVVTGQMTFETAAALQNYQQVLTRDPQVGSKFTEKGMSLSHQVIVLLGATNIKSLMEVDLTGKTAQEIKIGDYFNLKLKESVKSGVEGEAYGYIPVADGLNVIAGIKGSEEDPRFMGPSAAPVVGVKYVDENTGDIYQFKLSADQRYTTLSVEQETEIMEGAKWKNQVSLIRLRNQKSDQSNEKDESDDSQKPSEEAEGQSQRQKEAQPAFSPDEVFARELTTEEFRRRAFGFDIWESIEEEGFSVQTLEVLWEILSLGAASSWGLGAFPVPVPVPVF